MVISQVLATIRNTFLRILKNLIPSTQMDRKRRLKEYHKIKTVTSILAFLILREYYKDLEENCLKSK